MPFIIPSQIKKQRSTVQPRPLKQQSVGETQVLTKDEQRKVKALRQKIYIEQKQHDLLLEYLYQAKYIRQAVELEGACIVSMVDTENELLTAAKGLDVPAGDEETIEIKFEQQVSMPALTRLENEMKLLQRHYNELIGLEAYLNYNIRKRIEEKCKELTFE